MNAIVHINCIDKILSSIFTLHQRFLLCITSSKDFHFWPIKKLSTMCFIVISDVKTLLYFLFSSTLGVVGMEVKMRVIVS